MINYKIEYMIEDKDGESYTELKHCALPIKNRATLDETLDLTTFTMVGTEQGEAFEPFTKFKITIIDESSGKQDVLYRYVASDTVTQIRFYKPYLYNHELTLIEPTKILEREVCDNLTFTNTLLSNVGESAIEVTPTEVFKSPIVTVKKAKYEYQSSDRYLSPVPSDHPLEIKNIKMYLYTTAPTATEVFGWNAVPPEFVRITVEGQNYSKEVSIGERLNLPNGVYKIKYRYPNGLPSVQVSYTVEFSVYVYNAQTPPQKKSVTQCLERLLAVTPLRRDQLQPVKYKLDIDFAAKYRTVEAAEFAITSKTLWEALMEFGGYIHAIPYLKVSDYDWNTIDFMPLGGNEPCNLPDSYCAETKSWDMSQYNTCLDTNVENVMNVDNENQGTVTEPYDGGYMSVRAEEGVLEINEQTAMIPTSKPVYKVIGLEAGISTGEMADITKHIKESAQYNLLSVFETAQGRAKTLALEYTQGKKGIRGLLLKREQLGLDSLKNYAIINILKGKKINCSNADIAKIKFRIRYIPFVSMRVRQYKTNCRDFKTGSVLIYNQQANVVDSIAYGENLKGKVARLGNLEFCRTYFLDSYDQVPRVGTLHRDGYYVSSVDTEFWHEKIKTTVYFTKDYNKISEYLGLKNEQRFYEVSEKMSLARHMNYGEFCIIGGKTQNKETALTQDGRKAFMQTFLQNDGSFGSATCAKAKGEYLDKALTNVVLPVSSLACGNSLAIYFNYEDNYSAGSQSQADGERQNRIQQPVHYCDDFGSISKLRVNVYAGSALTNDDLANMLPQAPESFSGKEYFNYADKPFIMEKDSREIPDLTAQVHFVANRQDIIIGTAFGQNNPIVSGINAKRVAKIYQFPYNILNKLNRYIDVKEGVLWEGVLDSLFSYDGERIVISPMTASVDCKSWAFVTSDTNELILGVNSPIAKGQQSQPIYLNFAYEV